MSIFCLFHIKTQKHPAKNRKNLGVSWLVYNYYNYKHNFLDRKYTPRPFCSCYSVIVRKEKISNLKKQHIMKQNITPPILQKSKQVSNR